MVDKTDDELTLAEWTTYIAERDADSLVATDVSLETYMARYASQHCEWVEGLVFRVSPGEIKHNKLIYFLYTLLNTYFALRPIGQVIGQPFVMRLPAFPKRRREPDLLVVLNTNPHELKATYMDGPADIAIEVVSAESVERDHGDKLREYEQGGVPEYWIIDKLRADCRFLRLNDEGHYVRHDPDTEGNYRTPALPGLALHVPTLLRDELPDPIAIIERIKSMLD